MSRAPKRALSFLTCDQRRDRSDRPEYRVMVFESPGIYPRGTWHVKNGFFHADERIAFSVVLGESWQMLEPDAPFSEFDWASPQELRLIASLILCEVADGACMRFYPIVRFGPQLDCGALDLQSSVTVSQVRTLLLRHAARGHKDYDFGRLRECRRKSYDLVDPTNFALDRLMEFWDALASPNYVLLRGVYALMKSDMLACHYEFSEEAIVSLYIALDASFSLVMRQLSKEGRSNPTSHDAAVWIHEHFNAPFGLPAPDATEKYFDEFYDQRVMTLHPASRFGDTPYSPNTHCDIHHLRSWLRQLFAYLVLGRHDPGHVEAIREYAERFCPTADASSS